MCSRISTDAIQCRHSNQRVPSFCAWQGRVAAVEGRDVHHLIQVSRSACAVEHSTRPDAPSWACCMQAWLQSMGADLAGLLPGPLPTPRAWQLCEFDGHRTQVWRVPVSPALYAQLLPSFERLPGGLQHACAYHLGMNALRTNLPLLQRLREGSRAANGGRSWVSVETFTPAAHQLDATALGALMQACDVFSPNWVEAVSMVGPGSPEQVRCSRTSPPAPSPGPTSRSGLLLVLKRDHTGAARTF